MLTKMLYELQSNYDKNELTLQQTKDQLEILRKEYEKMAKKQLLLQEENIVLKECIKNNHDLINRNVILPIIINLLKMKF